MNSTYYAQIPTKILLSEKLTSFQKLLYADIQSLTNQKGYCYASNQYLSERHGKDIKHISKQISSLLKHEFLFVFKRPTGRNSNLKRKLFTQSTFIDYAKEHNIDITKILQREKNSVKNDTANSVKNDKHNNISNKLNKKRFIKNKSNESEDSYNKKSNVDQDGIDSWKKRKLKKIKRNNIAPNLKDRKANQKNTKPKKSEPKPKYKHTISDLRNYNELLAHGITDHKSNGPKFKSLDNLHALFSTNCKDPYYAVYIPEQYIDFKWDMDILIETFQYHLKYAKKYNMKIIKSIGDFIFSKGYRGNKSWSPLLFWHQKMKKTAANELTEKGKKFLSSLKRAKVSDAIDLDSSIINKVAKEMCHVSNKFVFMDGKSITMNYPCGMIDTMSEYIKEKTNQDSFKLVYITKNGFVDEFVDTVTKRNIIKSKLNGRSVFS